MRRNLPGPRGPGSDDHIGNAGSVGPRIRQLPGPLQQILRGFDQLVSLLFVDPLVPEGRALQHRDHDPGDRIARGCQVLKRSVHSCIAGG